MQTENTGSFEWRTSLFCKWKPDLVTPGIGNRDLELLYFICVLRQAAVRGAPWRQQLRGVTSDCGCFVGAHRVGAAPWASQAALPRAGRAAALSSCPLPSLARVSQVTQSSWVPSHSDAVDMCEDSVLLFAKAVSLHTTELSWRLCFATQQIRAEKSSTKGQAQLCFVLLICHFHLADIASVGSGQVLAWDISTKVHQVLCTVAVYFMKCL